QLLPVHDYIIKALAMLLSPSELPVMLIHWAGFAGVPSLRERCRETRRSPAATEGRCVNGVVTRLTDFLTSAGGMPDTFHGPCLLWRDDWSDMLPSLLHRMSMAGAEMSSPRKRQNSSGRWRNCRETHAFKWVFRSWRRGGQERLCSLQARQRWVQGTSFSRASAIGRSQTSHTPNVPCAIRANPSSIA